MSEREKATPEIAELRSFDDSPDAGDPRCLCSYCGERIEDRPEDLDEWQDDDYHGQPIRMWNKQNREWRFHPRCFNEVLERGIVTLNK